jgi:hypothetical protein
VQRRQEGIGKENDKRREEQEQEKKGESKNILQVREEENLKPMLNHIFTKL